MLVGLLVWLMRRQASGGALGGFGRSTARRLEQGGQHRVTFDDAAGIDEAEQELVEIVDFLKSPGVTPGSAPASPRRTPLRPAEAGRRCSPAR